MLYSANVIHFHTTVFRHIEKKMLVMMLAIFICLCGRHLIVIIIIWYMLSHIFYLKYQLVNTNTFHTIEYLKKRYKLQSKNTCNVIIILFE